MDWDDVVRIGTGLPEVEESTSYRTPALKVRGTLMVRLRAEEDGLLVVMCAMEEKEAMLASGDPTFSTTPHYDGHGSILVDLTRIGSSQLTELITEAWRLKHPRGCGRPTRSERRSAHSAYPLLRSVGFVGWVC